ncbi:hypothetical protein MASR2M15_26490 [Anaerolineales bacterium]
MPVRALLRLVLVKDIPEPYNQIQLKIFYPAEPASTDAHYRTGILPFDPTFAPAPMMIFLPGVNCSPHTYEWLAIKLAGVGIVTLIAAWLGENLPGRLSITPGINIQALSQDHYGSQPTSSSLPAIMDYLSVLKEDPVFEDNLDTDTVILAGHSAGGTMALQNAKHSFFPQVKASVSYCANPLATMTLAGWPKNTMPPLPQDCPTLMLGATLDGIGDHHTRSFGDSEESGADFIKRLFQAHSAPNSVLCIFNGANHHTICYPADHTIGRIFMDTPTQADEEAIRNELANLIIDFIKNIGHDKSNHNLQAQPSAAYWQLA